MFFSLWTRNVFLKPVKWFLSQNSQRGSLLVCDWLHSIKQNHFYVMLLHNQGCLLFQSLHLWKMVQDAQRRSYADFKSEKSDPKLPSGPHSHASRCPSMSRSFEQFKVAFVWTSQQCVRTLIKVWPENRISFSDTDMGRQLHPSGRQGNTVRTLSLIRQDVEKNCNYSDDRTTPSGYSPYYGIYVQQMCNRLDAKVTPSDVALIWYYVKRVMESRLHMQQKCNHLDARVTQSRSGPDMVLHDERYGKPVAQLSVPTASACIRTPPREIRDRFDLGLLSL
jgi:hypothetical protein